MVSNTFLPTALLMAFLLTGCGGVSASGSAKSSSDRAFLVEISDADLATFLANHPTQENSPEYRKYYQVGWDHILGPTAKARYDSLTKAPCSFSIQEQVHFLKSSELKGDQELDNIYLTYYCAGRERSNKFMQAARLRLKKQYPNLSPSEIETLAADELEKERTRWALDRKLLLPSRGLACTSNQVGGYVYTDCY